jgi:hypothetical protein
LDSSGSGQGTVTGSCEHSNESLDSIKGGGFLDKLSDCQRLKDSCIWWGGTDSYVDDELTCSCSQYVTRFNRPDFSKTFHSLFVVLTATVTRALALCLSTMTRRRMWGFEVDLHEFLIPALGGGEWSA